MILNSANNMQAIEKTTANSRLSLASDIIRAVQNIVSAYKWYSFLRIIINRFSWRIHKESYV